MPRNRKPTEGLENLAVSLGNKLQGNTQDYIGILTALKQSGVDTTTVLNGAGEAASNLANVSGTLIRGTAREQRRAGPVRKMFNLKAEDFVPSVIFSQRSRTGLTLTRALD